MIRQMTAWGSVSKIRVCFKILKNPLFKSIFPLKLIHTVINCALITKITSLFFFKLFTENLKKIEFPFFEIAKEFMC